MPVILGPSVEPIPGYRLIERLGRGGFGEVWKVEAPGGLLKAIKFVYGDLSSAGEGGEPAEQELKSLERVKAIRHPYILSLERFEVVEGQLLIVMELADRNLWDRFRDCRTKGLVGIPRDELLRYLDEAAEALDLMNHEYQLQHLDIKPQNLFVVYNHVKVADFGLVKDFEGKRGQITGGVTPVYAAPETFEGWVSRQSDQYSLAIVYQELLTGQRPFTGSTPRQLLLQHIQSVPDVSPLPESDRPIIARSLSKDPEHRYPTCAEMVRALRANGGSRPVSDDREQPAEVSGLTPAQSVIATPTHAQSPTDRDRPVSILTQSRSLTLEAMQTQPRFKAPVTHPEPELVPHPLPEIAEANTEQCATGVLMPAIVIGLGGLGGQVIRVLKAAMQSSIGRTSMPNVRFLAVDTDPAALRELSSDPAKPMAADELLLTALNRPSHYMKSDVASTVVGWMGSSLLYRLPRNPGAATLRSFGRLAFGDHAANLARRLKADLEAVRSAESLAAADQATGLGVRSPRPRVYIVAGLAGGTGGGMFIDYGFLARAALQALGEASPQVIGIFLVPHSDRPVTGPPLANTVASLIELNHFSAAHTRYEAKLDPKAGLLAETERPYRRCTILPIGEATASRDLGQAAGLLARELFAPVGRAIDRERAAFAAAIPTTGLDVQTAATFRLTAPYERLKRSAASKFGRELIRSWMSRDVPHLEAPVGKLLDIEWDRRGLDAERLAEKFNQAATVALGHAPTDRLDSLVAQIAAEVQTPSMGGKLDAKAICTVLEQMMEMMGPPQGAMATNKPKLLPNLFEKFGGEVSRYCDLQVAELVNNAIERPGYRIGGGEEMLRQIGDRVRHALAAYEGLASSLSDESAQLFRQILVAVGELERFSLKQMWKGMFPSIFVKQVRDFATKHYQGMLASQLVSIYRGMAGSVPEYIQEIKFCRQRLTEVERSLTAWESAQPESDPALGPGIDIFGEGDRTLAAAADRVVREMPAADFEAFDQLIQQKIHKQFRTLVNFCLDPGPKPEVMTELLQLTAEEYFGPRMGRQTTADLLLSEHSGDAVRELIRKAVEAAHPPLAGPKSRLEAMATVISLPETDSGQSVLDLAREELSDYPFAVTDSMDEVLVVRELRRLSLADLPHFDPQGRLAFQQALADADNPPHSRQDVAWLPVK